MKTFKISKKSNQIVNSVPLNIGDITLSGECICFTLPKETSYDLNEGGKLHLVKTASGNSGEMLRVCETDAYIRKIEEFLDGEVWKRRIYVDYTLIQPFTLASLVEIVEGSDYNYKITLVEDHNMVPADLLSKNDYKVYIRRGNKVVTLSGIAFCFPNEFVEGGDNPAIENECCSEEERKFNYETMERNAFLAEYMSNEFVPSQGDQVLFCTNPYYFLNGTNVSLFNNVTIEKYTDYFALNVHMNQDYDAKTLFQEHQVNDLFVKKIKNEIIPDFIDMEKVKYAPAHESEEEGMQLATGLTFNLHFRDRVRENGDSHAFEDTWHIEENLEKEDKNYWFGPNEKALIPQDDLYENPDFVNSSNLVGYLGFTDDDIYNQKNRVKQSFLRLSFYDSPGTEQLSQNLLYYSTIFMDSGELFGRFVKKKAEMLKINPKHDFEKNPVVWAPAIEGSPVCAITCQFTVNDEYDMTKSGEGFNLYLFREDAPLENDPQTIYMKVEFNHAGNGRTIPLICWPKGKGGKPEDLTIENYLENLYIKMQISYTPKGYVYSFLPNSGIEWKDERLIFNLFEPRIKREKK